MAEASGIRAGKAFVELSLNDKFTRQLDAAAKRLKDFGASITDIGKRTLLIGSAITAPLIVAAQRFAVMGSEINDAAARTGMAVESIQALKYAAGQTGAELGDVEVAAKKMSKVLFESAQGNKAARETLRGLNLTYEQLKDLKPEDQLALIGSRLTEIQDPAARSAMAVEIFGKSGTKLLPMLAELTALNARYKSLGVTFTPEEIAAADEFGDSIDDVSLQLNTIVAQIGAAIAQALQPFADTVRTVLRSVIQWTKENRGLVFTILATGAALIALGTTLVTAGLAIKLIGVALSGITATFGLIGSVIGFITNPIILVIAALGALTVYFLSTTQSGAQLLDWLGGRFTLLYETARAAFGGIADALAAGDITLAAQILWTALKLAWIQGTQELQNKWIEFKGVIIAGAVEAFYGVLSAWAIASAGLQKLWANTAAGFVNLWHQAIHDVTKEFDFLEQRERDRDKERIKRELAKPNLAPNVRALLERQLATTDQQADQVKRARDQRDGDDARARQQDLKDRIAAIDAERDAKLIENSDAERALTDAAKANAAKEIADLQKQKEDLERQLAALRDRAGFERKFGKDAPSLVDPGKLQDLEDVVASRASTNLKSAGIFNSAAIQSLQGSPVQTRIAKATEDTARNTRDLLRKPGPAFA